MRTEKGDTMEKQTASTVTVDDIIQVLDRLAPPALACSWDNPGLQIGKRDRAVTGVYVTLDADPAAVSDAEKLGCSMIVTHHPLIFRAIKKINADTCAGEKLLRLLESRTAVYSMHTNYDACRGGMADICCARLGLQKTGVLEMTGEDAMTGIGFTAELQDAVSAERLAERVREAFSLPFVQCYDAGRPIKRIACCPGSGRGELNEVMTLGADAFITGDMGHHEGLDLTEAGISLIDAGHFGLEHIFTAAAAAHIRAAFPGLQVFESPRRFPAVVL